MHRAVGDALLQGAQPLLTRWGEELVGVGAEQKMKL